MRKRHTVSENYEHAILYHFKEKNLLYQGAI